MTLGTLNEMTREEFVDALGGIFEHSPWVAERAYPRRPFASVDDLGAAMNRAVYAASVEETLALLRAHPDLGTRAEVSTHSAGEQAGAGLDRLTQDEFETLTELNSGYRERFGFPFLYAVKGSTKSAILEALRLRARNTPEDEFATAVDQVFRIARFRLEGLIE
jgi:2-oxo-4-hydroxy-4-carboxy-5-ureidoimidazoline decarboxylase